MDTETRDLPSFSNPSAEAASNPQSTASAPRLLRGSRLRNALYLAADGCCAHCHDPLLPGWHADHIAPWSRTGRTNVHEMQALCGPCNLRKGAK